MLKVSVPNATPISGINILGRSGRYCDYSDSPQSAESDEISVMKDRIEALELHVQFLSTQIQSSNSTESSTTPWSQASYSMPGLKLSSQSSFLDSEFWTTNSPSPQAAADMPTEGMTARLGDLSEIELIKAKYFAAGSIHEWMPIISKIRLDQFKLHDINAIKSDMVSLLLCMKLVQEVPTEGGSFSQSELYIAVKRFIHEQETKGILTFRLVQANVLLCVYELGQGIFPNAYLTLGHCARSGIALGLHNKSAPQLAGKAKSWVDWEERHRVWWMIVILDR